MGKRNLVWALLLVLAALPAVPAWSAPDTATAFSRIAAALSSGNGSEALALSEAALGQAGLSDEDRSRLQLDSALAHQLEGDLDAALADLTEAINAHDLSVPEQARALLERGLLLDSRNQLNDAIGDYGAVLRLVPNSAAALNNRANAFRRQNRFEDARRDYLGSLAADNPAPEYPYYGLGQIAESEGRSEEAKSFYTRALTANPGYALAAQRLTALGGTPPDATPITLRPPAGTGFVEAPVILHPPIAKPAPARVAVLPPPTLKPADYSRRDGEPGLRPAFDDPGGQQVQLGAWRQEAEAAEGWNHAQKVANGALSGYTPHILAVDLPGRGRYYRLRVTAPDARQLCAALTAKGLDCILAKD